MKIVSYRRARRLVSAVLSALILAACKSTSSPGESPEPMQPDPSQPPASASPQPLNLIPLPSSIMRSEGAFTLTADSAIAVDAGSEEVRAIGEYLASRLRPATGFELPIIEASDRSAPAITLVLGVDSSLGEEGYELIITAEAVTLTAYRPAGLFWAVQTLRQVLPPSVERSTAQPGPWTLPALVIRDIPRYEWRGVMLDVSRHFFGVQDVKRVIDLIAAYKLNRLHLHLSDDQGWRIMIDSWPRLASYGGSTEVGGGPGGFYTQAEYAEIVAYAQQRYIAVIPEIDMPGHTNAALASYPELNCDEAAAPTLYTGINVGFSSLCVGKEVTYQFIGDVIGELAALTPGPYIHIGGDEAAATPPEEYRVFIGRVQDIVEAHGKRMVGWGEIGAVDLHATAVAQHWHHDHADRAAAAVRQGARLIMSPGARTYLDMQYDPSTPLGLHWAGYIEVEDAYSWDPAALIGGVTGADILGVEAPLWSETLKTVDDIEYMLFPRLAALAEVGWSPADAKDWLDFRTRLAAHGPRLTALDVNFYRSPQIPWQ